MVCTTTLLRKKNGNPARKQTSQLLEAYLEFTNKLDCKDMGLSKKRESERNHSPSIYYI